ncbi:hypothetical protein SCLCIDRAFT_22978 [Scleroderma citrinum Foug A]|uniref:Uncharacterized protein n=1 Tax=Scleroderma citrinum Foug A TaxID=1036808 RepID=A0A0C3EB41_9AGAM|nr:hypothetical protein SCLCIDRAFT_22978 [Scleroderma citrinum Foug A]
MSSSNISGNNSNDASGIDWKWVVSPNLLKQMNNSIEVQIVKVDKQLWQRCNKIMKRVAEQEVQRKAEEEKCKAKEKAKQKAEEEKWKAKEEEKWKAKEKEKWKAKKEEKWKAKEEEKWMAKEEEKWKAEENKHRAEEEYRMQGEVKRKQKADVQEVTEAFRVKIAQGGVQGMKPKPPRAVSQCMPNEGIKRWYPPLIVAIDRNMRELVQLGGKGKARAEEPKDEEEQLEKTEESEDGGDDNEEEDAQHDADE